MEYIFNNENEWLEFRKGKITGTIASAVVGLNPYLSNTEAYEIVSGIKEPKDISEKPYVVKGKKAEDHIRSLFILDHPDFEVVGNNYVDKYILVVDDENPFIACTPDGFIIEKDTGRKGVLEIKTSEILRSNQLESWKDNNIPQNYFVQVLQEMYCTKADFGILVVELKFNENITTRKSYIIDRKNVESDINWLINEEIKFYKEYVLGKKRPALIL